MKRFFTKWKKVYVILTGEKLLLKGKREVSVNNDDGDDVWDIHISFISGISYGISSHQRQYNTIIIIIIIILIPPLPTGH